MKNKKNTGKLVITAVFSAMLCVVAPITIPLPISPVPVSLASCIIFTASFVLPPMQCVLSVLVYLILGGVGLPVFAGFSGGAGIIAGPTGGYLIGYLAAAFIASLFNFKFKKTYLSVIGMITGTLIMYFIGTVWFSFTQDTDFVSALLVCVVPYLLTDALKISVALVIGRRISVMNLTDRLL